jgi:hypothetical protein
MTKLILIALLLTGCNGAFALNQKPSNWPFPGELTLGDRVVEEFARVAGVDPFQVTCIEGKNQVWRCSYWADSISRSVLQHDSSFSGTVTVRR